MIQLKVALIVLGVALLFHIIGLATPNWSVGCGVLTVCNHNGLWKICSSALGIIVECQDYEGEGLGWIKACQAFGIMGVLLIAAAAILDGLCIFVFTKDTHKQVFVSAAITAFLGAASIILTIIIFGAKTSDIERPQYDYDLAWSFGMSLFSGILALIGGILVSVDVVQNP